MKISDIVEAAGPGSIDVEIAKIVAAVQARRAIPIGTTPAALQKLARNSYDVMRRTPGSGIGSDTLGDAHTVVNDALYGLKQQAAAKASAVNAAPADDAAATTQPEKVDKNQHVIANKVANSRVGKFVRGTANVVGKVAGVPGAVANTVKQGWRDGSDKADWIARRFKGRDIPR